MPSGTLWRVMAAISSVLWRRVKSMSFARRLLDGGQQQAPDAGRRHHPGGEAKHGPLELGPGLLHKEKYHRSP